MTRKRHVIREKEKDENWHNVSGLGKDSLKQD